MSSSKNSLLAAYLALAAVCILWGTTYLALRIGVTQFPAFLFSLLRFAFAGPILIVVMLVLGKKIPSAKSLFDQSVGGMLMITLGISIVGWAEVHVSSGVAAIICSMTPIWTVIINFALDKNERPTPLIVFGLFLGLSGIVLIFSEHLSEFYNPEYTKGIISVVLANLCWAIGTLWMKKNRSGSDPIISAGFQMLFGGLFIIPLWLIFDDYSHIQWSSEIVFTLGYLIVFGSIIAYACYFYALSKLPVAIATLYAYINPIIAVILGWLVLGEIFNAKTFIAIIITVIGIYLVNKGYERKSTWRTKLANP